MSFNKDRLKKIGIKILRITAWVVAGIFLVLVLVSLAIQIPSVQQYIKQKAVTFLSEKIGTKVGLEHISLSIPKKVVLEGIYFEDQKNDTLLYAGRLSVDTDLFALLDKRIELNTVSIDDLKASINRTGDSVFNFDYIIKAFSDSTAPPPDTTKKAWQFALVDVELSKINVSYVDALMGNDLQLKLETLEINMDEFDLEQSRIYVDNFLLTGVDASFTQGQSPTQESPGDLPKEGGEQNAFDFKIHGIDLQRINIRYSQLASKQEATLNLGKATLQVNDINLKEKTIDLSEFTLDKTFVAYHILQGADTSSVADDSNEVKTNSDEPGWKFSLDEIELTNNSIQYYDFNKPKSPGIDFNHLWISELKLGAKDIAVSESGYSIDLKEFSFSERSGFVLQALQGDVSISEHTADVKDFLLQTAATRFELDLHSEFSSLKNLSSTYPEMKIDANVRNFHIGLADLNYFIPGWSDKMPLKISPLSDIHLDTRVHGKINDLQIEQLEVSALKETTLQTKGTIKGLPDIEKTFFNIELKKFYTTSNDVKSILPDTLLPASIELPEWIDLSGNFSGTVERPSAKSTFNSDLGSIQLDVSTKLNSSIPEYDGSIAVNEFALGKLLKNGDVGTLDLDASFDGAGLTLENHQVKFKINMNSFGFKDYIYKDFVVDGNLKDYLFAGKASMNDPNLNFEFDGDFDYSFKKDKQAYHFNFDLVNADFNALHLTERPLKSRFTLSVDMDNANLEDLNGDLNLYNVAIYNGDKLYKVDSLLFASLHDEEKTELSIRSNIINGKFSGSFDILDLPAVMKDYFNTYYSWTDTIYYSSTKPQQFSFNLKIDDTSLLTDVIMPDLKRFVPGEIKGDFNSADKKLDIVVGIDEIEYGNISGEKLKFTATSDSDKLNYEFHASDISASIVRVSSLNFKGEVKDNTMTTEIALYDSLEKEHYNLGGIFSKSDEATKFQLLPDKVILNYDKWEVPEDNFITISKAGILKAEFSLSNNEQMIKVNAQQGAQTSAEIMLSQLKLSTLAHMFFPQDTLIQGIIQGDVKFNKMNNEQLLTADISVNDITLSESKLGDLKIKANQPSANAYDFNVGIHGPATNIDVKGNYSIKDSISMANVDARITSLDLAAIEPLFFGQVKDLDGNLTGKISLSGKTNSPEFDGKLTFENTSLIPTYINTKVSLTNESITFNQQQVAFSNFSIRDQKNNPFVLNGKIESDKKQGFKLDFTAQAKNFLMLDTKEGTNDLFFGKLIVNADVKVTGTSSYPEVDAQVSMGDESNLTYVVPQDDQGVMEQKGVVKFVDRDVHKDPFLASVERDVQSRKDSIAVMQGIALTAKIELSDKETLNILIDPLTGDRLTVNGNATLTLDIDPTGNMDLTGRYELTSGSYGITFYKLMKRDFEIQKGSSITWTGDPLDAELDITGIYNVEASPAELLQSEDPQNNKRLAFIVYLNVDGKILSPEISFSLDMKEKDKNAMGGSVYAKIQDINTRESDLNKQVFSLLVLKRFMTDNPFETQGGGNLENVARTSVSQFLSDQLNQMSENVKGVELTFDVNSYEDYSGEGSTSQTQLQVGVSKNLLSDRLVVKLSGNVDLEGDQQDNQNFSDYIGDLALEYKLTKDGRLRVTGFYNSDYDMIDGELKKTGTGLIYIKDYNTLRELFKANDKKD